MHREHASRRCGRSGLGLCSHNAARRAAANLLNRPVHDGIGRSVSHRRIGSARRCGRGRGCWCHDARNQTNRWCNCGCRCPCRRRGVVFKLLPAVIRVRCFTSAFASRAAGRGTVVVDPSLRDVGPPLLLLLPGCVRRSRIKRRARHPAYRLLAEALVRRHPVDAAGGVGSGRSAADVLVRRLQLAQPSSKIPEGLDLARRSPGPLVVHVVAEPANGSGVKFSKQPAVRRQPVNARVVARDEPANVPHQPAPQDTRKW